MASAGARLRIGLIGVGNDLGYELIRILSDHALFELGALVEFGGSESLAVLYASNPAAMHDIDPKIRSLPVLRIEKIRQVQECCDLVISTLETKSAALWEPAYAKHGLAVISANGGMRREPDVPVVLPEVNPHHLDTLHLQRRLKGLGRGLICALASPYSRILLNPVYPIHRDLGLTNLKAVILSGYALTGCKFKDHPSQLIPYTREKAQEIEMECRKILGNPGPQGILSEQTLPMQLSFWQIPLQHGIAVDVHCSLQEQAPGQIEDLWSEFRGLPQTLQLPYAPSNALVCLPYANVPCLPSPRISVEPLSCSIGQWSLSQRKDLAYAATLEYNLVSRSMELITLCGLLLSQGFLID